MDSLDVRGLSCPIPVLRTQKALEKGPTRLRVVGTGNTAKQNVTRFARSKGYEVRVESEADDEWQMVISKRSGS
ncbi:MAG: sulfurtransferase TusA family protein [Syntrophomonadaceae bacterium]|nr:sulfurtransferase TusA family protein [Syntrophomonadaceae bacterium]